MDRLDHWLARAARFRVLDGGLATLLEARGHALGDALWSARLLADDPDAIVAAHREYLEAGAECVTTASYQASLAGWTARGASAREAEALLRRSVELAVAARGGGPALVAASIGPYGATLADGSEYRGDDPLDEAELAAFHHRRFELLAGSAADLLAIETIPTAREGAALLRLLESFPGRRAWLSFSLRDGGHLADGTPLASAFERLAAAAPRGLAQLLAIGCNCMPPAWAAEAAAALAPGAARRGLALVVYPNSGERWSAADRSWQAAGDAGSQTAGGPVSEEAPADLAARVALWCGRGARLIGGCCRTGPKTTRALRAMAAAPVSASAR